jgi:hypothetical protein
MCLEFPQFGYDVLSKLPIIKMPYIYVNADELNSACLGREGQARKAGENASLFSAHTRQLSKACSRHLDCLRWSLEPVSSAFRGFAFLHICTTRTNYLCLLHSWGIITWRGWEFATDSHRCINRQKFLYRRSENVKIACKKRASGSFSFHVNFISLNDAVASLLIRTIIKVSDPNCTPFFSPISQPRGSPQKIEILEIRQS